ncbi:MAG: tetratricopeptide repeat protein, partial [Chthoniobacterales bacterium]
MVVLKREPCLFFHRVSTKFSIPPAWAYLIGFGVQADPKESVRWYQKAADQGHPTGLNNLGVLCDWGYGVERDSEKAKLLYDKADKAGFKGDWKKLRRFYVLQ